MGNDKAVKAGNTNIKIKLTPVDRSFYVVVDVYLAICGIIVLLPLLHVLAQSLSDPMMVIAGRVSFFPINPTLDIYSQVIIAIQQIIANSRRNGTSLHSPAE